MSHVPHQPISDAECAARSQHLDQQMRLLWIPGRRSQLASESFAVGHACRENGNVALAEANIRRVELLFRDQHPTQSRKSLEAFALVAASHNLRGLMCLDAGRLADARPSFDRAIEIRRQLQRLFPKDRENVVYLGGALCNLAHSLAGSDPAAAVDLYQQSLAVLRQPTRTCDCSYWDEQRQSWWCEQLEAIGDALGLGWVSLAPQFIDNAAQGLRDVEARVTPPR